MDNYVQKGDALRFTAPAGGVVSGNGYLIGGIFVVATVTAAATEGFNGQVVGVFTLPKVDATAVTEGQNAYWDDTNKETTPTASGNTLIGVYTAAVANTAGLVTANVRLNGSSV